jgi:hypothetical protein
MYKNTHNIDELTQTANELTSQPLRSYSAIAPAIGNRHISEGKATPTALFGNKY